MFGLFHGLGFAGGLKQAMTDMPNITLWAALISFSLGVEIAHQFVIIPAYGLLSAARASAHSATPKLNSPIAPGNSARRESVSPGSISSYKP